MRHFQKPLAGMVICGTGPHLYLELVRSQLLSGFPDPDHFDLLPTRSSTSHTSFPDAACSRLRILCGGSRRRDPVILLFRHHGPDGSLSCSLARSAPADLYIRPAQGKRAIFGIEKGINAAELPYACREDMAEFIEKCAQGVYQLGSLMHQAFLGSEQRSARLLLFGLGQNEPHLRLSCRNDDRLRISCMVFCRFTNGRTYCGGINRT